MILSKKYKEELDKIVMNDEMKKRILSNVLKNNIEVKSTIPVNKKNVRLKRNMQLVAACFTVAVCLSVYKNYPEFFKIENNNLKQNQEIEKSIDKDSNLENEKESEIYGDNEDNTTNNDSIKNNEPINSAGKNEENSNNNSSENKGDDKNKKSVEDIQKEQVIDNSNSGIAAKTNPEIQTNNEKAADNNLKVTATNQDENANKENDELGNTPMVTNGYFSRDYKTLEEAEKAVNFKINPVKVLPQGFNINNINVISNEIIQINYSSGEKDFSFRAGKQIENLSGDYNEYKINKSFKVNDVNINLKGNKDKIINLVTWEKGGISYSISSRNGVEEETLLNMIKSSL
jgi:AAA ATPase containing von Willebrand factor type A (vWA) domain